MPRRAAHRRKSPQPATGVAVCSSALDSLAAARLLRASGKTWQALASRELGCAHVRRGSRSDHDLNSAPLQSGTSNLKTEVEVAVLFFTVRYCAWLGGHEHSLRSA